MQNLKEGKPHINATELLPDRAGVPPMAELPEAEAAPEPAALLAAWQRREFDLICILGPTASGKTAYAVRLARVLTATASEDGMAVRESRHWLPKREGTHGVGMIGAAELSSHPVAEILSGDSRQVYRGMDIGTGKDLSEYGGVPYHLIDIAPAGSRYTIYEYQRDFEAAYKDIVSRGAIPILCGGSGLYIDAATCGYHLPEIPPDKELRASLEALDTPALQARLLALNPAAEESTLESRRRIIRAIEVAEYEASHPVNRSNYLPKKVYYIGTLVSREERVARIDARLDARLKEGLVEEVRRLLNEGVKAEALVYYGLEYKYVTQYVLGILSFDEMRTLLANAIHQFAKRQMTWFRGLERRGVHIHWINPDRVRHCY